MEQSAPSNSMLDNLKDEPKDEIKEEPKDELMDESKDEIKEEPKDELMNELMDESMDEIKEEPKDESKDEIKEEPKDELEDESKDVQLLTKGLMEIYEPPLATINTHLKELTERQESTLAMITSERRKLEDLQNDAILDALLAEIATNKERLNATSAAMMNLHKKVKSLKSRAASVEKMALKRRAEPESSTYGDKASHSPNGSSRNSHDTLTIGTKKKYNRVFVNMRINQITCNALLDTGSTNTYINEEIYETLHQEPETRQNDSRTVAILANGRKLKIKEIITPEIEIRGRIINHQIYVLPNVAHAIVGIDVIRRIGFEIFSEQDEEDKMKMECAEETDETSQGMAMELSPPNQSTSSEKDEDKPFQDIIVKEHKIWYRDPNAPNTWLKLDEPVEQTNIVLGQEINPATSSEPTPKVKKRRGKYLFKSKKRSGRPRNGGRTVNGVRLPSYKRGEKPIFVHRVKPVESGESTLNISPLVKVLPVPALLPPLEAPNQCSLEDQP